MTKLDRYILLQLLVMFGFFALILVSVFWINNIIKLFDRLITDGHSTKIVLEFTILSLPDVIRNVLPLATFGAAVFVTNRLSAESELTVLQATGFSPWRLAWPVFFFGLITSILMTAVTHYLVPSSLQQLRDRESKNSDNLYARLLRPGTFLHPADGITLYIRDISMDGRLNDILLSDRRDLERSYIYTAKAAYLLRDSLGTTLAMVDGQAQALSRQSQLLSITSFADLSYDISTLIEPNAARNRDLKQIPTSELIRRPQQIAQETGRSPGSIRLETHGRFHQPLLCLVTSLIGFAVLLSANFSRFGIGRQILIAISLLVFIKLTQSAVIDHVRSDPSLWPFVYLPTLVGMLLAGAFLAKSASLINWQILRAKAP